MKKENLKTIILTLLIFSSVILSIQIWLLNPVWSDNLNPSAFFANLFNKEEEGLTIKDTGALSSIFSPRSFLLTYNDGRIILNTTEQNGKEVREAFNSAIKNALNASSYTEISEEDWQTTLRSNSIYADYSVPISCRAFTSFLDGTQNITVPISSFNQAVISMDTIGPSSYICLRNSKENKQVKISLANTENLSSLYESYSLSDKQSYSYAFEINLDKKVDDTNVQQTVLMNSYVLIPVEPVKMNIIMSEKVEFSESISESILALFGYNPKTARKYTENNGNLMFLDSDSTLKLHPDTGYIEYVANEGAGISLPGGSSLSSAATGCGKLLDDIFNLFNIDNNVTLFINSPLDNDTDTNHVISFDYLFKGNKIHSENHGCKIHISNGKITEFYANVKNYHLVEENGEENAIDVLDSLYLSMQQDTLVINSLYTGYSDSSEEMPLKWQAQIEGSDEIITPTSISQQ